MANWKEKYNIPTTPTEPINWKVKYGITPKVEVPTEEAIEAPKGWLGYLPSELRSTIGMVLPGFSEENIEEIKAPSDTWKELPATEKASLFAKELGKNLKELAKEIIKAPARIGLSIALPWIRTVQGKPPVEEKPVEIPYLGKAPTIFKQYENLREAGFSPLESGLFVGSGAAMDLAISAGMARGLLGKRPVKLGKAEFRPKGVTVVEGVTKKGTWITGEEAIKSIGKTHPEMGKAQYYRGEIFGGPKGSILEVVPTKEGTIQFTGYDLADSILVKAVKELSGRWKIEVPPEIKAIGHKVVTPRVLIEAPKAPPPPPAKPPVVPPPVVVTPPPTLPPTVKPTVYYHTTTPENYKSILEKGFDFKKASYGAMEFSTGKALYFSKDKPYYMFGEREIKVDVSALKIMSSEEYSEFEVKLIDKLPEEILENDQRLADAISKELIKKGIDAVDFTDAKPEIGKVFPELRVINPKAVDKIKIIPEVPEVAPPKEVTPLPVSSETAAWLKAYTGEKPPTELPSISIISDLAKYRPIKPIKLYRGIRRGQLKKETAKKIQSWTTDKEVAKLHAREKGKVITKTIKPEDILIDSAKLPGTTASDLGFVEGEEEVIVIPGLAKKRPIKELKLPERKRLKVESVAKRLREINWKTLPIEYQALIRSITENFDFRFRAGKTLVKREAIRQFVERQEAAGETVPIPEDILEMIEKTPLNDMTTEQLEMVYEEVKSLVHLGRFKNRLLKIQGKRKIDEVVNELVEQLEGKSPPPAKPPKPITPREFERKFFEKKKEGIVGFLQRTYRMQRMMLALDGYIEYLDAPSGAARLQRTFIEPVEKATDAKLKDYWSKLEEFRKFVTDNDIDLKAFLENKEVVTEELGPLTPIEKIGIYHHSLNEDNLTHFIEGNLAELKAAGIDVKAQIKVVVDSLTPKEKALADWFLKAYADETVSISKVSELVTGKAIVPIESYTPIRLEWRAEPTINYEQDLKLERAARFWAKWASAGIKKPFLRERTHKAMQPIKINALEVWLSHLEKVAHYKAFAPTIRDLQHIIADPSFRKAYITKEGRSGYQVLNTWLKQVAETDPLQTYSSGEKTARTLRVNAVSAVLGFNLTTAMKQFPSYFSGMAEIGELPTIKGLLTFIRYPKEVRAQIKEFAPQIYRRSFEREIAEAKVMRSLKKRALMQMSKREVLMILATTLDRLAVNSIWKGGFDDYLKKHPGEYKKAATYATRAIQRTQPFFSIKDLPEYWRSGEFMRALTIFTNQLNQYWNYYRFDIWGKWRAKKIGFAEVVRKVIECYVIPALIIGIIARSRPAKNFAEVVKDLVRQAFATFPLVGRWIVGGIQGYKASNVVPLEVFSELQDFVNKAWKQQWAKAIKEGLEVGAIGLGLPLIQTKRVIEGILDLASGKSDDWMRLIWGSWVREKEKKEAKPPVTPTPPTPKLPTPPTPF